MAGSALKLLIADDEAPARARLRELVGEIGGWTVVAEAGDGQEVLDQCAALNPDVVLLDIRMPVMDGIEVAGHLCRLTTPPAIVFTTAFDQYAVDAFETHAIGYLLKPVRRKRLFRALEHAARLSRMQLAALSDEQSTAPRETIPAKQSGTVSLIPAAQIVAFHADQKYVRLTYLADDRLSTVLIDESLKSLEHEFAEDFVRIHRNSLIRASSIESLSQDAAGQYFVSLRSGGSDLPVSRRQLPAVRQRLRSGAAV